jgi:hypothetical protein
MEWEEQGEPPAPRTLMDELAGQNISKKSRQIYTKSSASFISWLVTAKPDLVNAEFMAAAGGTTVKLIQQALEAALHERTPAPPIMFDQLTTRDFIEWLDTLRTRSNRIPGFSTYSSHRASLHNLFRDYKKVMYDHFTFEPFFPIR